MKKVEGKSLVVKANRLIEANYRLNLTEQRIIHALCSKIQNQDKDFQPYTFKVAEFLELLQVQDQSKYATIPAICTGLMKRILTITEGKSTLVISWISSARYDRGSGEVTLCFDPNLKPYLLELKSQFTKLNSWEFYKLRSCHAQRIYELLKQYEGLGERTFKLADLRKTLGIPDKEYKQYNDFKKKIILVAQRELAEHTAISFEFQEIKEVRKVVALKFTITSNSKNNQKQLPNMSKQAASKPKKQPSEKNVPQRDNFDQTPYTREEMEKYYFDLTKEVNWGDSRLTESAKTELKSMKDVLFPENKKEV